MRIWSPRTPTRQRHDIAQAPLRQAPESAHSLLTVSVLQEELQRLTRVIIVPALVENFQRLEGALLEEVRNGGLSGAPLKAYPPYVDAAVSHCDAPPTCDLDGLLSASAPKQDGADDVSVASSVRVSSYPVTARHEGATAAPSSEEAEADWVRRFRGSVKERAGNGLTSLTSSRPLNRKTLKLGSGLGRPVENESEHSSLLGHELEASMSEMKPTLTLRETLHLGNTLGPANDDMVVNSLQDFVEHPFFDYFSAFLILLNMAFMGLEAEHSLSMQSSKPPETMIVVNYLFCIAFTGELLLRMMAYGGQFFTGEAWNWNLLDFVLVMLLITDDIVFKLVLSSKHGVNFSFLRVLRVLRTIRILRVVRVCRFIVELRILLVTIGGAIRSLFWTIVLLVMFTYSFSIYIAHVIHERNAMDPFGVEERLRLGEFYGGLITTMWTLFQSVSGGVEWRQPSQLLTESVSPWAAACFGGYIAFTVFALINIITGIFLNTAVANAEDDKEQMMIDKMRRFLVDKVGDGVTMTWEDFEDNLGQADLAVYLRGLGLRADQAKELFTLLEADEDERIFIEDFLSGFSRLNGNSKAVDFAAFMFEFSKLKSRLSSHMNAMESAVNSGFLTGGMKTKFMASNRPSRGHT